MSGWLVRFTNETDTPHVVPIDDLREHEPGDYCWCKPIDDEGVIIHNAMAGREKIERGELKPN